jgi:hypothetical protein
MRLDSSELWVHNLLLECSVNGQHSPDSRASAALVAGIVVDLAFAVLVLLGRGSAGSPGAAVEPTEGPATLVLGAAFGAPALLAALGARGRPVLIASAAIAALALGLVPISVLSFLLLVPGSLFLYAAVERDASAQRHEPRKHRRLRVLVAWAALLVSVAVVVDGGDLALFLTLRAATLVAFLAGCALIIRSAAREHGPAKAVRVAAGGFLVVGLSLTALLLPLIDTATVCWQTTAGRTTVVSLEHATQLGRPADAGSWASVSVGPQGVTDGAGCDGGVPTANSVGLAVAALAAGVAVAIVVVPRRAH